ncbi:hypothetical protein EUGRSUZ_E03079 [Eucalyptus grandis]|uniref:Uncharacterized protein n=2 Tax=Eucalyptus grandis TaxID=71139 RepID=A0ACC3L0Y3_EUCGR|nr:hypothetical protein EUGRSUZ_E03079 [Eucalyptus grandis]
MAPIVLQRLLFYLSVAWEINKTHMIGFQWIKKYQTLMSNEQDESSNEPFLFWRRTTQIASPKILSHKSGGTMKDMLSSLQWRIHSGISLPFTRISTSCHTDSTRIKHSK